MRNVLRNFGALKYDDKVGQTTKYRPKWLNFEDLKLTRYMLFYHAISDYYETTGIQNTALWQRTTSKNADFYKNSIRTDVSVILFYPIYIIMGLLTHLSALYTFPKRVYEDYSQNNKIIAGCLAFLAFIVAVPYSLLQDIWPDVDEDAGFFDKILYMLYQLLMPIVTLLVCLCDMIFSVGCLACKSGQNMAILYITVALLASCFGFNALLLGQYLTFIQPNLQIPLARFWFLYAMAFLLINDMHNNTASIILAAMLICTTASLFLFSNMLLPVILINLLFMLITTVVCCFKNDDFFKIIYNSVIIPEIEVDLSDKVVEQYSKENEFFLSQGLQNC
jgi:hypothetical protein